MKSDQAWGTPYYAAPEQWEGQTGKVSDIYALGVVLYQLLTGCTPYQGTPQELKEQHQNASIPLLKDYACCGYFRHPTVPESSPQKVVNPAAH